MPLGETDRQAALLVAAQLKKAMHGEQIEPTAMLAMSSQVCLGSVAAMVFIATEALANLSDLAVATLEGGQQ